MGQSRECPVSVLLDKERQSLYVLPGLCIGRVARRFYLYGTAAGAEPEEYLHGRFPAAPSLLEPALPFRCTARAHHTGYRQSLQAHLL